MIFYYISVLFILLIRKTTSAYTCGQTDLTQWCSKIFGSYLPSTFACSATLELATNETTSKVSEDPDLGVMGYECYSYWSDTTAFSSSNNMIPFLVDEENTLLCYISVDYRRSEVAYQDPLYRIYFQEALKIHESITNFIFDESFNLDRVHEYSLTGRYRQEYFRETDGGDATGSIDYYNHLFQRVQSYELLSFDSFFWTSPATMQFFDTAEEPIRSDSRFLHDYSVQQRWVSFKDYLAVKVQESKDPCGFGSLSGALTLQGGRMDVSLQVFEAVRNDPTLMRSCLVYVVAVLSQDPAIHHLSMRLKPVLLNYRARSIQQTAQVGSSSNYAPYAAAGLLGDGQVVTIADTGVDSFSCYFYDSQGQVTPSDVSSPHYDTKYRKVIQYNYNSCGAKIDAPGGHGTHVCGIITGGISGANIFSDGMYDGVAPNAKLSVSSLGKPDTGLCIPPINQLYGPGYMAGSRIHSNSWGSYFTGNGFYTDQDTDRLLNSNPDFTIFFAAGNAGNNGNGAKTTTMEACSKNVIAVGSSQTTLGSQNITYVAFYSSKGPAYDNRLKPDLVSPGDGLLSANSQGSGQQSCSTIEMTGTSMAAPSAAGAGALIRQYFIDSNRKFWLAVCNPGYPSCRSFSPSGAMVKAILLHSCMDMTMFAGGGSKNVQLGTAPDYTQGYGRIGLMNVLPLKGVVTSFDLFVADAVNIKENNQIVGRITISNSKVPLRATISWYDVPNVEGVTTKALINNLDLTLNSPSQQTIYPNGLNNPDNLNNNERIVIQQPQTGTWQIKIQTGKLPGGGNQLFSLVITAGGRVSMPDM